MDDIEGILENLRLETGAPFTFEASNVDGLYKYLATIDWSEPWLIGLIVFHLVVTLLAILTRRYQNFHIFLFLSLLLLCYLSERINELGAKNWRLFAREQYFDANGLFISVVFSSPIIINLCIILILWLYECYKLIVEVIKMKKSQMNKSVAKNDDNKKEK